MSKKDYELIAAALRQSRPNNVRDSIQDPHGNLLDSNDLQVWKRIVLTTASFLAGDNYRFNSDTFIAACER